MWKLNKESRAYVEVYKVALKRIKSLEHKLQHYNNNTYSHTTNAAIILLKG